jgi:hypothetical protein
MTIESELFSAKIFCLPLSLPGEMAGKNTGILNVDCSEKAYDGRAAGQRKAGHKQGDEW